MNTRQFRELRQIFKTFTEYATQFPDPKSVAIDLSKLIKDKTGYPLDAKLRLELWSALTGRDIKTTGSIEAYRAKMSTGSIAREMAPAPEIRPDQCVTGAELAAMKEMLQATAFQEKVVELYQNLKISILPQTKDEIVFRIDISNILFPNTMIDYITTDVQGALCSIAEQGDVLVVNVPIPHNFDMCDYRAIKASVLKAMRNANRIRFGASADEHVFDGTEASLVR